MKTEKITFHFGKALYLGGWYFIISDSLGIENMSDAVESRARIFAFVFENCEMENVVKYFQQVVFH